MISYATSSTHRHDQDSILEFFKFKLLSDLAKVDVALNRLTKHLRNDSASLIVHHKFDYSTDTTRVAEPESGTAVLVDVFVRNLQLLVKQGRMFPTIVADAHWPYYNQVSRGAVVNHCPAVSLTDISSEPVSDLVAEKPHFHLWATNGFLREVFNVFVAWEFQYKSCSVWVKNEIGMGTSTR